MVSGHTKFSVDAYFGHFKKKYRKSNVHSMDRLVEIGDNAVKTMPAVDVGKAGIKTFNWIEFFGNYYKKIPGIQHYHQFQFEKAKPELVMCRVGQEDGWTTIVIRKTVPVTCDLFRKPPPPK
jgi:hypothetical protein